MSDIELVSRRTHCTGRRRVDYLAVCISSPSSSKIKSSRERELKSRLIYEINRNLVSHLELHLIIDEWIAACIQILRIYFFDCH